MGGLTNKRKDVQITVAASLLICLMAFFLFQIVKSYFKEDLGETSLVYYEGNLISFEEREVGELRKSRKLFFRLQNQDILFNVSNTSLQLLDEESFRKCAMKQDNVRVATSTEELNQYQEKRVLDKLLNHIVDGRVNPQVYSIICEEKTLLDYEDVSKANRRLANSNMYFGAPFLVIGIAFFSLIIYANWKVKD